MMLHLRRVWIQLTANRKQFGILCGALGVGLLLWARLIIVSNIPRTAMADDPDAVGGGGGAEVRGSESGVRGSGSKSEPRNPNTEIRTPDREPRPRYTVYLDVSPLRDPFLVSDLHFPRVNGSNILTTEDAKSPVQPTEDPQHVEAMLTRRLQAMVDAFSLDATGAATGSEHASAQHQAMAVIGGTTYRLGAQVPALANEEILFRLTEVRQRSVILEWEGRTFELKMQSPGA